MADFGKWMFPGDFMKGAVGIEGQCVVRRLLTFAGWIDLEERGTPFGGANQQLRDLAPIVPAQEVETEGQS